MTTDYNILTLGYDCSPAAVLRNLGLREHALPFDWVVSSPQSLNACFKERFQKYHTDLYYNTSILRMVRRANSPKWEKAILVKNGRNV
jgi:hypothetical protein